mgnify:FL=1
MFRKLAATLLIAVLALVSTGCNAGKMDPGRRLILATKMVEQTAEGIMTLHSLGILSDDDVITAEPYIARAAAALTEARTHIHFDPYTNKWVASDTFDILLHSIFAFMREPMMILEDGRNKKRVTPLVGVE